MAKSNRLTRDEIISRVNKILKPYISHPDVTRMKNYIQHGNISTFDHALCVTYKVYENSYRNSRVNLEELTIAAFLHDFYLYDWHEKDKGHRWHGFRHAKRAAENAERVFGVSPLVKSAILSHMWPLNLTRLPASREAWILTVTDKIVSSRETVDGYKTKLLQRFKNEETADA